jgi:hypothetical protein
MSLFAKKRFRRSAKSGENPALSRSCEAFGGRNKRSEKDQPDRLITGTG